MKLAKIWMVADITKFHNWVVDRTSLQKIIHLRLNSVKYIQVLFTQKGTNKVKIQCIIKTFEFPIEPRFSSTLFIKSFWYAEASHLISLSIFSGSSFST